MKSKVYLKFLLASSAVFAIAGQAVGQDGYGLNVGDPVEDFTLSDQDGNEQSLFQMLKKGPVALVFYRSCEW